MRLVFITRYLSGGGAERVTSLIANGFAVKGHAVKIISFKQVANEYPLEECVLLDYVPEGLFTSRVSDLKRMINDFAPNYVVSLGSKYNYIFAAGLFGSCKVILSERNDPARKQSLLKRAFTDMCYRLAWGVVFQTSYASDFYDNRIRRRAIIANPAPEGLGTWNETQHRKIVINCCRLTEQKNLPLLLRAFALFQSTHSEYDLVLYGDGPLEDSLRALAAELGIEDSFRLFSYSDNIHDQMIQAAMFVSSSDYEGISNSILEAVCMGVPVVSTNSRGGGSNMLLAGGLCGELVPCGDPRALACAMGRIADNGAYAHDLYVRSREHARTFSLESVCDEWLNFMTEQP